MTSINDAARIIVAAWRAGLGGSLRVEDAADAATIAVCELHASDPAAARDLQRALAGQEGGRITWPAQDRGTR